jgi:hypothetical protein
MTGRIEKFDKVEKPKVIGAAPPIKILGAAPINEGPPVTLDATIKQDSVVPEIKAHEEIVVEDDGKIRRNLDGTIDLRFRAGKDRAGWDRVKRLEDE